MIKKSAINLLPGELRGPTGIQVMVANLNKTSLLLVVAYLSLMLGLAAALFFFSLRLGNLQAQNQELERQVVERKNSEGLLLTLTSRLKAAQELFGQSAPAPKIVTDIGALTSPGVSLLEAETRENGAFLTFTVSNSSILADFLETILSQNFSQVKLISITNQRGGGYALTLEIR